MKEVADALKITIRTVAGHKYAVMELLATENQLRPGPVRHQAQDHLRLVSPRILLTPSELPIDTSLARAQS